MKTGKITAKLRDAVPVCLMVEGKEVKRYKNIELPEVFPEAPIFAAPANAVVEAVEEPAEESAEPTEEPTATEEPSEEPATMEILYNVTLAQFLRYVRQQCEKKGIYMEIDRDEFEKPSHPESYSYTVINGEKKCHSASYRTTTKFRRKLASYQTVKRYTRFYYTDDLKNMRKSSFATMTGRRKEPMRLASPKSANPLRMIRRPSSLIGTAPCITRYANLPLTTRKPATAILLKNEKPSENAAISSITDHK